MLKHKAFLCVLSYASYGRRSSMKIISSILKGGVKMKIFFPILIRSK